MKKSGILLHISSLHTPYGIGDLGGEAYHFADYLAKNGHSYWQILPLNHPGCGNSPYNPISAFAGNPYLISPQLLHEDGLLSEDELIPLMPGSKVDFEAVYEAKDRMLALAAQRYLNRRDIQGFTYQRGHYIRPYAAFVHLCKKYGHPRWYQWEKDHRRYSDELFEELNTQKEIAEIIAIQAIFEDQLMRLKRHVSSQNIKIIGDTPIYLSYESAEVWAMQELFDLDEEGRRLSFAGVPPDAFSEDGQLWGNPIYDWDKLLQSGFELFMRRFAHALEFVDLLRLDHFIGYVNYWKVPLINGIEPKDAREGSWMKAKPRAFFDRLREVFDPRAFIAEDLGILTQEVCHYRDELKLPGMIVLQFCFDDGLQDVSLFPQNRIIYSGTHDNNTTKGWYNSLPEHSKTRQNIHDFCAEYLPEMPAPNEDNIHQIMAEIARLSACGTMILPMQDVLGLDESARMNIPGTAMGNWDWRLSFPIAEIK